MSAPEYDTVWINGSVGAGKTSTADRLGDELERRGVPGAVIDVDWLRRSWPSPAGDPFRNGVALANARPVVGNFRAQGARIVVVAGVIENADERARCAAAVGAARMLHVRLTVDPDTALSRLRARHGENDSGLEWHLRRHPELAQILDTAHFEHELVIDTTTSTIAEVARRIADHVLSDA